MREGEREREKERDREREKKRKRERERERERENLFELGVEGVRVLLWERGSPPLVEILRLPKVNSRTNPSTYHPSLLI